MSDTPETLKKAQEFANSLSEYGNASLVYVTAEYEPFSSKFKPDICFKPKTGPNAFKIIFFEVIRKFYSLPKDPIKFLDERKVFAEDYLESDIAKYVILNDKGISDFHKKLSERHNVYFSKTPSNSTELIQAIKRSKLI
ncbi:hypothetical protein NBRC116583_02570 [Arenicella sp. 4NH20-0111]|uniref:hypothetical protein n=1 Tax=Arenicella sp. 4NH20-0111 TaxID=3127648 RepID=UPI003103BDB6